MSKKNLDKTFEAIRNNKADFISEKIYYKDIFSDRKDDIIEFIEKDNLDIKKLFNQFVKDEILSSTQYPSFSKWVKRLIIKEGKKHTLNTETISSIEKNKPASVQVKTPESKDETSGDKAHNDAIDSTKIFHGFDMNEQPDEKTNPIPVRPEIDHLYLCEIFAKNHELNNDRIVNILLCAIKLEKKNIFTKTWSELLLKNGETKEEYYARLQGISDSDVDKSYEILDATTCMQGYALAAKYDGLKLVRRNNK